MMVSAAACAIAGASTPSSAAASAPWRFADLPWLVTLLSLPNGARAAAAWRQAGIHHQGGGTFRFGNRAANAEPGAPRPTGGCALWINRRLRPAPDKSA